MLSEIIENCLAWACDDQCGLDDDEIKEIQALIKLIKDYGFEEVNDLEEWIEKVN
jgi:hypothetical protein